MKPAAAEALLLAWAGPAATSSTASASAAQRAIESTIPVMPINPTDLVCYTNAAMKARLLLIPLALLAATLGSQDAEAARVAKATISRVTVGGTKVTVRGRVKLPRNTARQRRRTRVLITLTGADHEVARFKKARINSKRIFK